MSWPVRGACACLLVVSSFLAAGCGRGSPDTAVSGKLLENGEAVKPPAEKLPPGDRPFRLWFVEAGASADKGQSFAAQFTSDDGAFRVDGPNGKGLPPGKYRVNVEKGAVGKSVRIEIKDVLEIPKASSVAVEVDLGKKTAKVIP